MSHGFQLQSSFSLNLQDYIDVDWVFYPKDCKSKGGYCVFFGSNLASQTSTKQGMVSWSSVDSKYRGLAFAAIKIVYIQSVLKKLCIPQFALPCLV